MHRFGKGREAFRAFTVGQAFQQLIGGQAAHRPDLAEKHPRREAAQLGEDPGNILRFDSAENQGPFPRPDLGEPGFAQHFPGVGVVRAVEDDLDAVRGNPLKPPRPRHLREAFRDAFVTQPQAQRMQRGERERGVPFLMRPRQRDAVSLQRLLDETQRRAPLVRLLFQNLHRLGLLRRGKRGHALQENSRFLPRDRPERLPEPLRVIHPDRRDHADIGRHRRGRIEPPAHARFQDDQLAAALVEPAHRHRQRDLEKGGVRLQRFADRARFREQLRAPFLGDHFPGNPHPLPVVDEVRRGKKPRPFPASARHRIHQRAGAALAVRPRHVRDPHAVFRKRQELPQQTPRPVQPQLDAELLRPEKPVDRLRVVHRFISAARRGGPQGSLGSSAGGNPSRRRSDQRPRLGSSRVSTRGAGCYTPR